jgi:hypothetical protein
MSKPEAVYNYLVENTPEAYCDDCISKNAGVEPRQQVNPIARALSLTTDFDRAKAVCADCRGVKETTRSLRHASRP